MTTNHHSVHLQAIRNLVWDVHVRRVPVPCVRPTETGPHCPRWLPIDTSHVIVSVVLAST